MKSYLQVLDKENQTSVSNFKRGNFFKWGNFWKWEIKNPSILIIAQLNISSLRNKFDSLVQMLCNNLDILFISYTKIDSSFPTGQFQIESYRTCRLYIDANGGDLLLYIRENIPSTRLDSVMSIKSFYIETNKRKKKWLIVYTYNPNKNLISNHLKEIDKNLGNYSSLDFSEIYICKNLINDNNCFKNPLKHQSSKYKHTKKLSKFCDSRNRVVRFS